jgi:hypothetical protein
MRRLICWLFGHKWETVIQWHGPVYVCARCSERLLLEIPREPK